MDLKWILNEFQVNLQWNIKLKISKVFLKFWKDDILIYFSLRKYRLEIEVLDLFRSRNSLRGIRDMKMIIK